jgi:transposase-like protein
MSSIRRNFSSKFKSKVALEAVKNELTMSELSKKYSVHSVQIGKWKKELLEHIHELFEDKRKGRHESEEASVGELYEQIGRLKIENEYLKKKL